MLTEREHSTNPIKDVLRMFVGRYAFMENKMSTAEASLKTGIPERRILDHIASYGSKPNSEDTWKYIKVLGEDFVTEWLEPLDIAAVRTTPTLGCLLRKTHIATTKAAGLAHRLSASTEDEVIDYHEERENRRHIRKVGTFLITTSHGYRHDHQGVAAE